jgi:hypothetical protein
MGVLCQNKIDRLLLVGTESDPQVEWWPFRLPWYRQPVVYHVVEISLGLDGVALLLAEPHIDEMLVGCALAGIGRPVGLVLRSHRRMGGAEFRFEARA